MSTAVHVYCSQQRSRGERLSRHWYDLVPLDDAGFAEKSITDRVLTLSVMRHKTIFFRETDAVGSWIDYEPAVSNRLQMVPKGSAYEALADDCARMLRGGMLLDEEEQFDDLMGRSAEIETRANRTIE